VAGNIAHSSLMSSSYPKENMRSASSTTRIFSSSESGCIVLRLCFTRLSNEDGVVTNTEGNSAFP